jgi:DNA-binding FadR family transcriptional regulator
MVEVIPKRGTNIQPREKWNLLDRDILEIRQFFEPAAAELAEERASADEVEQLYWRLDEMAANVDIAENFMAADLKFHGAAAARTGENNTRYFRFLSKLCRCSRVGRLQSAG